MSDLELKMSKPTVAIVGRPNVGKSTFFNKIIKKRKAITDHTPGVTRDPIYHDANINNILVTLVDTGGWTLDNKNFDKLVSKKSLDVLKNADVILLMVEIKSITPEDEEFIKIIRQYSDKTILIVNKVDTKEKESLGYDFYRFGFKDYVFISAEHSLGFEEFNKVLFKKLIDAGFECQEETKDPCDDPKNYSDGNIRVTILGQPNTGKSTLNNLILKKDVSIVSEIAGTTRDIVENKFEYKKNNFIILDTAGIRRKKNVGENIEYYSVNRAIKTIEESDVVFLIIDAVSGLSEQDKKIAGLVIDKGKGLIFVYNKLDLLETSKNMLTAIEDRLRFLFPVLNFVPFIPISALKNIGIDKLLDKAVQIYDQFYKKVETSSLNKSLKEWVYENPVPGKGSKTFKVKYLTQAWVAPQIFTLFVNKKKGFPESWLSYLVGRIRKTYKLNDVHIKLIVKDYSEDKKTSF